MNESSIVAAAVCFTVKVASIGEDIRYIILSSVKICLKASANYLVGHKVENSVIFNCKFIHK